MPSAVTPNPRLLASTSTLSTMAPSWASWPSPSMNERSILSTSTGKRFRYASEE